MTSITAQLKKGLIFLLMLTLLSLTVLSAKTLRMAFDADPVSLDPHEQLSGGTLQLSHWTFDPLIRWTKDLQFEPRLAESWEYRNDLTLRVKLRRGVKFHSGNTFTANDVKWTFDRLLTSPDFKALYAQFEEVKVVDDYTVDIVMKSTYPLLFHQLTYIFPMDSKFYSGTDSSGKDKGLVAKNANTFASRNLSGTGPFKVTTRQQGVRLEFERFNNYWDKNSPGNVSKIIFTPIAADPTRVAALISGDVDFIAPVEPNDLARLRKNRNINLVEMSGTRIITFQLNQNRRSEFKDARVRQAIDYAVDNVGIVKKIMKGFATPAAQMSPSGYLGHDPKLKPRYDLRKARQLMKAAGYANGFSVTMMAPNDRYVNDQKIAEAVAAMLARIKIKVNLKTLPKAQYWPEFDNRAADIMMIGWHSDTEDSANFSEFLTMTPDPEKGFGQYNSGNYSNPRVDKLTLDAASIIDTKKRTQVLQEIENILYEEAAFIPLHWQNLSWAAKKGVEIEKVVNPMNFPYLGDLVIK